MPDDERILGTLADIWYQAVRTHTRAPDVQTEWWNGFVAGTAVAITVASGLPPEGLDLEPAITAGCEIARAHGTR